mgnify:CR=1 FL=1
MLTALKGKRLVFLKLSDDGRHVVSRTEALKDEHGRLIQVEVLSIQGEPVKANGWTLVADVTWEGDQPIVGTVPGYDGPMVDRATLDGHCDICNAVRERSHVIVCEHPQEGRKVVGGQCVRDLLGHDFSMAFWPSLDDIEESWGSSGPRGPLAFATLDIIAKDAEGSNSVAKTVQVQVAPPQRWR